MAREWMDFLVFSESKGVLRTAGTRVKPSAWSFQRVTQNGEGWEGTVDSGFASPLPFLWAPCCMVPPALMRYPRTQPSLKD